VQHEQYEEYINEHKSLIVTVIIWSITWKWRLKLSSEWHWGHATRSDSEDTNDEEEYLSDSSSTRFENWTLFSISIFISPKCSMRARTYMSFYFALWSVAGICVVLYMSFFYSFVIMRSRWVCMNKYIRNYDSCQSHKLVLIETSYM